MDFPIFGALLVGSFCSAALITFGLIRLAPRLSLLQHVNARSSHTKPTPTGGGVAFTIVGLIAGGIISFSFPPSLLPFLLFAFVLAALGFLDDLFELPSVWRFAVQSIATAILFWYVDAISIAGQFVGNPFALLLLVIVFLASIWLLNLVNFMDGIDGLVGTQAVAIIVAGTVVTCLWFEQPFGPFEVWMIVTSVGVSGFLLFNFPPAKIFMGDAGSYLIAAVLLLQFLYSASTSSELIYIWLLLVAPITSDATATLIVRMLNGEKWYAPHRQHLYQKLSRRWKSHKFVTLAYLVTTLCVYLPLGAISAILPLFAPLILAFGYIVSFAICIMLGAGRKD